MPLFHFTFFVQRHGCVATLDFFFQHTQNRKLANNEELLSEFDTGLESMSAPLILTLSKHQNVKQCDLI